jgi:hypothetical protein
MSRETEHEWVFSQANKRQSRAPLWRRIVTIAVAAAFTVVTISLGLVRHRHAVRDESGISFGAGSSKLQSERLP